MIKEALQVMLRVRSTTSVEEESKMVLTKTLFPREIAAAGRDRRVGNGGSEMAGREEEEYVFFGGKLMGGNVRSARETPKLKLSFVEILQQFFFFFSSF